MSGRALVAIVLLAAAACGDDARTTQPARPETAPEKGPPHASNEENAASAHDPAEPPFARVIRFEAGGAIEPSYQVGQTLDRGSRIDTAEAQSLEIDLRSGARVDVAPGARGEIGEASPASIVVGVGGVRGLLPPAGNSPRPPLRIATPAAVVEIGGSGEAWVSALADGTTWVAVLGGSAAVLLGDADAGGRPQSRVVAAGRALRIAADGGFDEEIAPPRLEAVRARAAALASSSRPRRAPAARSSMERLIDALDDVLGALEEEEERGSGLEAEHERVAQSDPERARALRSQIVAHAQALHRLRQQGVTRWERAHALALLLGPESGLSPEELASRRERAARLL